MNRTNRYREFRQMLKQMVKKLAAADACPLGPEAIGGYLRMRDKYWKLNDKWQAFVDHKVIKTNEAYFTPDETGMCGWDYDQLFL